MNRGLAETKRLWPVVRTALGLVHRAAKILDNPDPQPGAVIRRRYRALLRQMADQAKHARSRKTALPHFLKVTRSYGPGLFHG